MRRAGKGYAIENNIRNKNPQWMVVDPKQSLFNDDYYIDNGVAILMSNNHILDVRN